MVFLISDNKPAIIFAILIAVIFSPATSFATDTPPITSEIDIWQFTTFLFGSFVGMTEILSRYRDEPWKAAGSLPGCSYMTINGVISVCAYNILINYDIITSFNSIGLATSVFASTSAMAIFRSKLFIYSADNGNEYPIGPDIVLSILMKTVDRQIDRRQAFRRENLVFAAMSGITDFNKAAEFVDANLLAFQNLSDEEKLKFASEVDKLKTEKDLPNNVKILALGYSVLTITGESNFNKTIKNLKKYLEL